MFNQFTSAGGLENYFQIGSNLQPEFLPQGSLVILYFSLLSSRLQDNNFGVTYCIYASDPKTGRVKHESESPYIPLFPGKQWVSQKSHLLNFCLYLFNQNNVASFLPTFPLFSCNSLGAGMNRLPGTLLPGQDQCSHKMQEGNDNDQASGQNCLPQILHNI